MPKCEDCGTKRNLSCIIKRNACASDECCYKYVCKNNCKMMCHGCHMYNKVSTWGYEHNVIFTCINCGANNNISLNWHGISTEEYERRM